MRIVTVLTIIIALMMSATTSSVYATEGLSPRAALLHCRDDVYKFCPNIRPGGGRIAGCLILNEDRLSRVLQAAHIANKGNCDHMWQGTERILRWHEPWWWNRYLPSGRVK